MAIGSGSFQPGICGELQPGSNFAGSTAKYPVIMSNPELHALWKSVETVEKSAKKNRITGAKQLAALGGSDAGVGGQPVKMIEARSR